jgi:1,4-dihydroxy-2-naphthoate octaprenyltransferase
MPVFLMALGMLPEIHPTKAFLVFFILHFLVYPASNGYNSYMDRDTESIGGVANPLLPTKQLFYTSIILDVLAVLFSCFISIDFSVGILIYILVSRAYSYRGIRLKKYPFIGYATVIVFQGFFTFGLVYYSCGNSLTWNIPMLPAIASSLLIGGFYPLTQIYQHQSDKKDGVITISYILGYRGNFIFCGIVYSIAMLLLSQYYINQHTLWKFFLFMTIGIPVVFFFLRWAKMVWHNFSAANFDNTMKMNLIASCCTNLAFLILLIAKYFE